MASDNSERTRPFQYGLRSDADRIRLRQQIGDFPAPHLFQPDEVIPHMCSECLAIRAKPWHLSDAWLQADL